MYKRLLQEEGNNSFSMPRAQVIMALNCNSESIWAFSIGLYFFQVTNYSPTRYSHKMGCSHSYTVWLHPWTLCDSHTGCCGAALISEQVGQKSGVGWARSSRAEGGLWIWDSVMRLIQERAKWEPANEITIQGSLTSDFGFSIFLFPSSWHLW